MLTSYNGWTASPNPADFGGITPLVVAGHNFAPGVRSGDVYTVFLALATDLHNTVEPVTLGNPSADEWGYSYRQNRNANNLSCHASGTAIDVNATLHPNGRRGTFSAAQVATIHSLVNGKYRGLVRWGGDFTGTADEMHFEIIGTPGQIAVIANDIHGGGGNPPPANVPPSTPGGQEWLGLPPVRSRPLSFQRWYNAYPFSPALLPIISPVANNFGPQSLTALEKVQARYGLVADGIDGPLTKHLLWTLGWRG